MSRTRSRGRTVAVIAVLCLIVIAVVIGLVALTFSLRACGRRRAGRRRRVESSGEQSVSGQVASTTGAQPQIEQTSGEPFKTCEVCHPDYLQKPDSTGDLVFSHPTHIAKGVKCVTCHATPLGHYSAPTAADDHLSVVPQRRDGAEPVRELPPQTR